VTLLKNTLAGLILCTLTACVSNPVPLGNAKPVANSKEVKSSVETIEKSLEGGNIVLIRRYAQPTAYPISVRVDDEKVASLGQRKYTAIALPKGEYDVVAKWPFIASQSQIKFKMNVIGDKKQYFEFLGESNFGLNRNLDLSPSFGSDVRELETDKGVEYLSNCCVYVKPKI